MGQLMSESEEGYGWASHPPVSRGTVAPILREQQPDGTICLSAVSTGWTEWGLGRKAHALGLQAGRPHSFPEDRWG